MFFDTQKLKTELMAVIAKSVEGGLSIGADEVEVAVARDQGLEVSVRRGSVAVSYTHLTLPTIACV